MGSTARSWSRPAGESWPPLTGVGKFHRSPVPAGLGYDGQHEEVELAAHELLQYLDTSRA